MKFFIVFALLIVAALAAPTDNEKTGLEQEDVLPDQDNLAVETSDDGSTHEQTAVLNNAETDTESLVVNESNSFVGDDGQTYTVDVVDDENGFQQIVAHLPDATDS